MKKSFIFLPVMFCSLALTAQLPAAPIADSVKEKVLYLKAKMEELNKAGVETRNDSLIIDDEVLRLLNDSEYRKLVYPAKYEWPSAIRLMQQMELKKAFWHLINLYHAAPESRNLIVTTVVMYDSIVPMDKVILNSFYTYSFADPRVCRVKNGKPEIFRPDLLQDLLANTREIVSNIVYYRDQKQKNRAN